MVTFVWQGSLLDDMNSYERHIEQRIQLLAMRLAARIEQWMKANAPWTDQTGAARSELFAVAEQASHDLVEIYFSHGTTIDYGIWLEVRNAGRYAIIRPALEQIAIPELQQMLQEVFR
jgi:hypothetical protein